LGGLLLRRGEGREGEGGEERRSEGKGGEKRGGEGKIRKGP